MTNIDPPPDEVIQAAKDAFNDIHLCQRCGRAVAEHRVYYDDTPPDSAEADFGGNFRGFYCPSDIDDVEVDPGFL